MVPATVLGKRAGPIDAVEESMVDALQQLSATPNSLDQQQTPLLQANLKMNYQPQQQQQLQQQFHQQQLQQQHQQFQQQAQAQAQAQVQQAQQQQAQQQQAQQLYHPLQTYTNQYFPQSPPQDMLASPQSPATDFGEKRRRVNTVGSKATAAVPPQQPLTPHKPNGFMQATGQILTSRQLTLNQRSRAQKHNQVHGQNYAANSAANTTTNAINNQQQQQQQQIPSLVPGMPFLMDPLPPHYAAMQPGQPQSYEKGVATGLAPPLTPGLAPVPTTVVTKPAVVPSMAFPTRHPAAASSQSGTQSGTQSATQSISPSVKPWKPQEIVLPKVIDAGPFTECDDSGGHYVVRAGEWFAGRYLIIKLLGQGTFGKVAQAWDERVRQYCAIKIIRAVPKYRDASKIELRVLSLISGRDPCAQMRCVRMRECFDYRNHVCIVTDLHDISVYDFLKENQFLPFPGNHVHSFAKQILTSVAFIHSMGLVHTDLKPENILLASSASHQNSYRRKSSRARRLVARRELDCTDITLIDFGSAIFDDEYHSNVVSTRHYRAPEIILGSGWSYPCDLWSIGCVLVELCTGRVLFETRNDLEHLHMMERTLGTRFSSSQLSQTATSSSQAASLISSRGWPPKLSPLTDQTQRDAAENMQTISQLVQTYAAGTGSDRRFWDGFLDLVMRLMALDPKQRITAQEALQHPWIAQNAGERIKP